MQVVLRKMKGRGASAIVGTVAQKPTVGHPVVVAFRDGIHEFITSTVVRVMAVPGSTTLYFQTRNSVYRMDFSPTSMNTLPPPATKGGDGS